MLKKENISSQLIVLNVINEVKYMNFGIHRYHLVQIFVLVFVPPVPCRPLVNYYESQMSSKTCRHVLIRVRSTYWSLLQASVGHMEASLNRLFPNPLTTCAVFFGFHIFQMACSKAKNSWRSHEGLCWLVFWTKTKNTVVND